MLRDIARINGPEGRMEMTCRQLMRHFRPLFKEGHVVALAGEIDGIYQIFVLPSSEHLKKVRIRCMEVGYSIPQKMCDDFRSSAIPAFLAEA